MPFKLKEILFLQNLHPTQKHLFGLEVRLTGLEGEWTCADGTKMKGLAVELVHNKHQLIVHAGHLRRGVLERGDMDTKITWDRCSYIPREMRKEGESCYRPNPDY